MLAPMLGLIFLSDGEKKQIVQGSADRVAGFLQSTTFFSSQHHLVVVLKSLVDQIFSISTFERHILASNKVVKQSYDDKGRFRLRRRKNRTTLKH